MIESKDVECMITSPHTFDPAAFEGVSGEMKRALVGLVIGCLASRTSRLSIGEVAERLKRIAGMHLPPALAEGGGGEGPPGAAATTVEDEPRTCIICCSLPRRVRFIPCGHATLCDECYEQWRPAQCYHCRGDIQTVERGDWDSTHVN